jgi:DNA-binding HxlR family transcriptional regulator
MTPIENYKAKKLEELENKGRLIGGEYGYDPKEIETFLSQTIDELYSCLPDDYGYSEQHYEESGRNKCVDQFNTNLQDKICPPKQK